MALRDVLVRFGIELNQQPLVDAQNNTDQLLKTLQGGMRVLQGFAAALGVQQIWSFISATVKAADDVGDLAARLGITTDEFQVLKAVADDVGTSVGAIQTGFRTLAGQMKEGSKELAALGVVTKNADGSMRSVTDVFWDAGAALGDTTDQATRLQLAQKLLGRGGLELLPIFTGGAEAVAKYRAQIEETAVVFDAEFIEASDRLAKKQDALARRWERIRVLLVTTVLPAFEWLVDVFGRAAVLVQKFVSSGRALQTFMATITALFLRWAAGVQLGANVVGRLLPLVRGLLRFLLRFALPVLIIDELITLFRGGDTLIGRFIDKLFGIGTATKFVEGCKVAFQSLVDTLVLVLQWLGIVEGKPADLEAAFLRASEGIGKTFDALFSWMGQKIDALAGKVKDLVASIPEKFLRATIGDEAVDALSKRRVEGGGQKLEQGARDAFSWLDTKLGGGFGWAPEPALAPTRSGAAAPAGGAPVVNNTITVEGNATPATAREIADKAGKATGAAIGRDRAAIGAELGL